ncbi:MAG: anti-sigma factor [Aggregatilineales bacterium]
MSGEHNINPQFNKTDCETLADLLPAYSMGLTDAGETQLVEQLLVHCPEYRDELESYKELASAMLFSAPQVSPPASIAANLMKLTAPVSAPSVDEKLPSATTSALPLNAPSQHRPVLHPTFGRGVFAVAGIAAAVILILMAMVGVLVSEVNTLREDQDILNAELQTRNALLEVLGSDSVQTTLAAQQDGSDASGMVTFNPEGTVAMIRVSNFTPSDASMTYQAWLIQGEERISAGLFDVDGMGEAVFIFTAPQPLGTFDLLGITLEPAGGSDGPTSSPVVAGSLATESG